MKTTSLAIVAAMAAGTVAHAQEAVQWRVEDGGNGHWYQVRTESTGLTWLTARSQAHTLGGELASLAAAGEDDFIRTLLGEGVCGGPTLQAGPYVGGYQDRHASDYAEPDGGWRWTDGSPFPGAIEFAPDNYGGHQDYIYYISSAGCAAPYGLDDTALQTQHRSYVVEWSADCNGDGIVDYGQILDGTLFDGDGNWVPDCCELGYACDVNLLVNGSFEEGPSQPDCTWVALYPGDTRLAPWSITHSSVDRLRLSPSCSNESWQSFDGEITVDLDGFTTAGGIAQTIATDSGRSYELTLELTANCGSSAPKRIRISAGDSVADFETSCQPGYPQPWLPVSMTFVAVAEATSIRIDSLSTSGTNGPVIDDVRVSPYPTDCVGDVNNDGQVNGADISVLLGFWGLNGKPVAADINKDGSVDGADLAQLLGSWGPCP